MTSPAKAFVSFSALSLGLASSLVAYAGPNAAVFCQGDAAHPVSFVAFDIAPYRTAQLLELTGFAGTGAGALEYRLERPADAVRAVVERADVGSAVLVFKKLDGGAAVLEPRTVSEGSTLSVGSLKRLIVHNASGTSNRPEVNVTVEFEGGSVGLAHYTKCRMEGARVSNWNELWGIVPSQD